MSQKYALVSGVSSGLGLEICNYLINEEYIVFGCSRSGCPIEHINYFDFEIDLRIEEQVSTMFDQIENQCDGLHLVVNCAGIFQLSAVEDMTSVSFKDHLETNILGPFHIFKFCRDFIIEQKTHFIQLSSIASEKGFANCSAYCASKHALNGLVNSLEEEWKKLGVKFSSLLPGAIDTPLWDNIDGFERDQMLTQSEFLYVFDMVVRAPQNVAFHKLVFMHKSGFLD